jgi:hypothetical protein
VGGRLWLGGSREPGARRASDEVQDRHRLKGAHFGRCRPAGDGLRSGLDLETVALAGEQTRVVGHDGESLGGKVASLMTFPEHGIVASVTSNISYADTFAVALNIAQAFAEQGKSPARK